MLDIEGISAPRLKRIEAAYWRGLARLYWPPAVDINTLPKSSIQGAYRLNFLRKAITDKLKMDAGNIVIEKFGFWSHNNDAAEHRIQFTINGRDYLAIVCRNDCELFFHDPECIKLAL